MKTKILENNFNPLKSQSTLFIDKLPLNKTTDYSIDHNILWVKDILNHVHSGLDLEEGSWPLINQSQKLLSQFTTHRVHSSELDEHILLRGELTAYYYTQCVRCLKLMPQEIQVNLAACFVPSQFLSDEFYSEQTSIYTQEQDYDLYFYEQKRIDMAEFFQEQIYLNIDDCPLHAEDCKGLCQFCGQNLEEGTCQHQHI